MKKKLYIGCALTNLEEDKREELLLLISEVKNNLKEVFEILEFVGVGDIGTVKELSPRQVYDFDIKECLMKTDYFLAFCDFPAIGLGYEIGTAVEKRGIPVLALARKLSKVSRAIIGIDHSNFHFSYYESAEDVVQEVLKVFPR